MYQCPKCGNYMMSTTSGFTCMNCGNRESVLWVSDSTTAKPIQENKKLTKYCMECGKIVNINANYCENCGVKLIKEIYANNR